MRKSWLMCVLLGAAAWGQAAPATPPPSQPGQAPPMIARPQAPATPPAADTAAAVPADAAVITINGVCPPAPKTAAATKTPAAGKAPAAKSSADCKTVITKAEFEKMANLLSPTAPLNPQQKKQLANTLGQVIPMAEAAKKKHLDQSPQFVENLRLAKMQILSRQLITSLQQEAGKISPADISAYYKDHADTFEQFNLDRLYVPRNKQQEAEDREEEEKNEKLTPEQQKAKQDEEKAKTEAAEKAMADLAKSLRDRAAAGEEFVKLQKEAFDAAGMKVESPTVNTKVRRTGLQQSQAAAFDLKPGEVSAVMTDAGGYYIYKLNSKDELPLEQVQDEIKGTLQNQRYREAMDKVSGSTKTVMNDAYFGAGPMMPQQRMPGRMPPPVGPTPPGGVNRPAPPPQAPTAQTPPPAQPPAAKPN